MQTVPKIAVVGIGYVGLSNAILLAQHNPVCALDIDPGRVAQLQTGHSPVIDPEISAYLRAGIAGIVVYSWPCNARLTAQ